jgi:hypothetical protein
MGWGGIISGVSMQLGALERDSPKTATMSRPEQLTISRSPMPWAVRRPCLALALGNVAQIDPDSSPVGRSAAHRVDENIVHVQPRRHFRIPGLPAFEARERTAFTEETLTHPTVPLYQAFNPAMAQIDIEHVFSIAVLDVINNGMTPERAIDKAFKRAEEIFSKYPITQA